MASIIPALIVAVVLFLRLEAFRGDIITCTHKVDTTMLTLNELSNDRSNDKNSITELSGNVHGLRLMVKNLEESFVSLTNKWTSRDRVEKAAAKRKEKEETPEAEIYDEQNQLMIPFPDPQQQQPPIQKKRKFGDMP
jgi:hypothetical protein